MNHTTQATLVILVLGTLSLAGFSAKGAAAGGQQTSAGLPHQAVRPPVGGSFLNFQRTDISTPSTYPEWIAVADFNGDGKSDFVVADECPTDLPCADAGEVSVFLGNGNGTFQKPVAYTVGYEPTWVGVADFNGDGIPDLVVFNSCGQSQGCSPQIGDICVLLGNGDGTFQAPIFNNAVTSPAMVAAGDLNGDGFADLAVTIYEQDSDTTFYTLLGNGDGTFQAPVAQTAEYSPSAPVIADLNHDGKMDIAVADYCGTNPYSCGDARKLIPSTGQRVRTTTDCGDEQGAISVLLGNGDGTFQPQTVYCSDTEPLRLFSAVLNNGDAPDLVAEAFTDAYYGTLGMDVFVNNGNGTLQNEVTYALNGDVVRSFADFNGDGALDALLLGAYDYVDVDLGNGNGTLSNSFLGFPTLSYPVGAATGYFNGQGAGSADFVVGEGTSDVGVFLNESATHLQFTSSPNPSQQGQPVTFTATVTAAVSGLSEAPHGSVTFASHGKKHEAKLNSEGVATFTTSDIPAGSYHVTATYSGDLYFNPNQSAPIVQVVNPQ